jgi:hypothetical protein
MHSKPDILYTGLSSGVLWVFADRALLFVFTVAGHHKAPGRIARRGGSICGVYRQLEPVVGLGYSRALCCCVLLKLLRGEIIGWLDMLNVPEVLGKQRWQEPVVQGCRNAMNSHWSSEDLRAGLRELRDDVEIDRSCRSIGTKELRLGCIASAKARWATGVCLTIDGGRTCH